MREEFSESTKRTLALRVGMRCSNPECRVSTTGPVGSNGVSNIGVAAHIVAASDGGPRNDYSFTRKQRKDLANAIWLCTKCAKIIDDDPGRYTVGVLRYWRQDAESMADREKGQPSSATLAVRFASIQMDPRSFWAHAHRLGKVWTEYGGRADFGFHEIPERAHSDFPDKEHLDPIIDITIANDNNVQSVISEVGFVPVDLWSTLKGIPPAYKVYVIDEYDLPIQRLVINESQTLILPDPIAVPAGGTCRFKLRLQGYNNAVPGNESIIRFMINADGTYWHSRFVYMGIY